MRKFWFPFALALGLSPAPLLALPFDQPLSGLIQRRWEVADGLPNPAVRALAETPDGLLWVGTRAGLARFDGRSFEPLSPDSVSALAVDRDGVLWAGTDGGGLLRYQGGQLRRFGQDDGLAAATVTALTLDPDGRLVVATAGGGLARREGGDFLPLVHAAELPGPVLALALQGRRIVLATSCALWAFEDGRLERLAAGLPHPRALAAAPGGEIALATDQGLLLLGPGGAVDPFHGTGPAGALALAADAGGGGFFVGTLRGLWRAAPRQGRLENLAPNDPLAEAVVATLLPDRRGRLWVGSLDGGLFQLRENPLRHYGAREGLGSEIVTSVAEDAEGRIWMSSRGGGLARLEPRSGQLTRESAGLPEEDLWSVASGPRGELWLGANRRGLLRRSGDGAWQSFGPEAGLPEGPVQAVRTTRDGAVYLATDNGLGRFAGGRLELFTKANGLPSNAIRDIFEDAQGRLWIATMGGLARALGGGRFVALVGPEAPQGVLSIWEDEQGALWLATVGALVRIEKNGQARALTTRDGLYCDDLSCAIGDGAGHLFMATAKGLVRVSLAELRERLGGRPTELHQWIFDRRGGLRAGISNNGTAALLSRSGRLYFASRGGLIEIDPRRLRPEPAPPATIASLVETPRPWWRSLSPATSGSRLEFAFSAATLAAPDDLEVRYRLLGFDPAWRPAGREAVAVYSRVPPGTYTFLVETSDQEGRFEAHPTAGRKVEIAPRWSLVLLLPGLALGLATGALALLHRLRIRWLERRKARLQQEVEAALAELQVLRGMLPICSSCKRIRDDQGYWEEIGSFLNSRSGLAFERGVCPDCEERRQRIPASSGRVIRVARALPGGSS